MTALGCATCAVRDRAACSVLDEAERDALATAGRTRSLSRGETLFAAGDEETACATLISGALKVSAFDAAGEERILALIHPAGFVGEMFAPFAHYDVVSLTDSRLCVFGRADMAAAVDRYPALARALLRRSQEDLHAARDLLALSGKRDAAAKLAALLLGLAQGASDSSCHAARAFALPLTRGEMAGMLGITIETVSRRLSSFERDGLIRRTGARWRIGEKEFHTSAAIVTQAMAHRKISTGSISICAAASPALRRPVSVAMPWRRKRSHASAATGLPGFIRTQIVGTAKNIAMNTVQMASGTISPGADRPIAMTATKPR